MMGAEYDLIEIIDSDVKTTFLRETIISTFASKNVGDKGSYRWTNRVARLPEEPPMSEYLKELLTETYQVDDGTFQFPHVGERIQMTTDQYKRYVANNALVPNNEQLGSMMAIAADKRQVWRDPPGTGKGSELTGKHYGALNAGAGTVARPTLVDGGTTNGKWDVANKGLLDLGQLRASLIAKGFSGEHLALFYPATAEAAMLAPNIVTGGVDGSMRDLALKFFPAGVYPVQNDNAATPVCLMTAAAETVNDFQIVAMDMSAWIYVYNKPIQSRLHLSEDDNMYYYDTEAQGALVPYRTRDVGGTLYKGIAEIDTCDIIT